LPPRSRTFEKKIEYLFSRHGKVFLDKGSENQLISYRRRRKKTLDRGSEFFTNCDDRLQAQVNFSLDKLLEFQRIDYRRRRTFHLTRAQKKPTPEGVG
jgi:hypothetical protein